MIYEVLGWLVALLFGVAYNWHIDALHRRYGDTGMTGIFVVAGVAITLLIAAVVPTGPTAYNLIWRERLLTLSRGGGAVLYVLPFFCASGLPMVAGSLWRYLRRLSQ